MILRESDCKTELQKALDRTGEQPRTEEHPFQDVAAEPPAPATPQWLFRAPERPNEEQLF